MNTSTAPPTPSPDFSDLFQLAPVSLWLEDYQAVRELFGQWRAQGVVDLRSYLRAEPARVAQCSACIRVLQVNRRTLSLFEAELHTHLVDNLPRIFRDDMFQQHVEELVQLWNGQGGFEGQSVNYTLGGRRLDVLRSGRPV